MAIVAIISGSFCHGDDVADLAAEQTGYSRIEEKLLEETSRRYDTSREKLRKSMTETGSFFDKYRRLREKNIARLKNVLADLIQSDNLLLSGPAGHLLPRTVSHTLKVCVIANIDYRIEQCMKSTGLAEKEARKTVQRDDEELLEWTKFLFNKPPFDETLYDIVIPMHDTSVDDAAEIIRRHVQSDQLQTTGRSRKAAGDFVLASNVNLALVEAGYDHEVAAYDGQVTITIDSYVDRLKHLQQELAGIASKMPGVSEVKTKIGPNYKVPAVNPWSNLEGPPKILLVDDEKEFVHTLSERLETRNLESSVVYDGEQALEFVNKDEPDVMVLDLMMPGIDGMEVLRRVKSEHPYVEVIILTGHGSDKERSLADELGAFAYLNKPVGIDDLARVMKDAYQKVNRAKAAMQRREESGND